MEDLALNLDLLNEDFLDVFNVWNDGGAVLEPDSVTRMNLESDEDTYRQDFNSPVQQVEATVVVQSMSSSSRDSLTLLSFNQDSSGSSSVGDFLNDESPPPLALKSRKTKQLPEKAIKTMIDWYENHLGNPYPSEEERKSMAQNGQISENQVKAWFANKRNRTHNTRAKKQAKRCLSTKNDTISNTTDTSIKPKAKAIRQTSKPIHIDSSCSNIFPAVQSSSLNSATSQQPDWTTPSPVPSYYNSTSLTADPYINWNATAAPDDSGLILEESYNSFEQQYQQHEFMMNYSNYCMSLPDLNTSYYQQQQQTYYQDQQHLYDMNFIPNLDQNNNNSNYDARAQQQAYTSVVENWCAHSFPKLTSTLLNTPVKSQLRQRVNKRPSNETETKL